MKFKEWNKKKVYSNRLLKLAKFLREEVPKDKFDFSVIMGSDENIIGTDDADCNVLDALCSLLNKTKGYDCGTVGCAIGWMPRCFPKDITYSSENGNITVVPNETNIGQCEDYNVKNCNHWRGDVLGSFDTAQWYFGLSSHEAQVLFTPNGGKLDIKSKWRNKCLEDATPTAVAAMIESFVEAKKIGEFVYSENED